MNKEINSLFQLLISMPTDIIRLYPKEPNLHEIANNIIDQMNTLQVQIMQQENTKDEEINKLRLEIKQLQNEIAKSKK